MLGGGRETPTRLTLGSLNQQSLEALVRADFNGPVGGLAQHCRGDSVKGQRSLEKESQFKFQHQAI